MARRLGAGMFTAIGGWVAAGFVFRGGLSYFGGLTVQRSWSASSSTCSPCVPIIVLGEAMRARAARLEARQSELSTTNLALENKVEAQSLLAAIVASSDDAIISKTLDGIITSWNKGAERLFGWTRRRSHRPIDSPDRAAGTARPGTRHPRSPAPRRARRASRRRARAQGRQPVHISVTISPVRDRHGHIIGASKTARDITARKAWEAQLVRSEEALRREPRRAASWR